jgi:hypothetical protein
MSVTHRPLGFSLPPPPGFPVGPRDHRCPAAHPIPGVTHVLSENPDRSRLVELSVSVGRVPLTCLSAGAVALLGTFRFPHPFARNLVTR